MGTVDSDDHSGESVWGVIFGDDRTWRTRSSALQDLGPVFLYAVAVGALSLLMPVAVQTLVNTVAFGTLVQPLVVLSLVVLIALGMSAVFSALSAWTVELLERRFFLRWYLDVASRMAHLGTPDENREELVNRLFEVYAAQKSIRSILVGGLEAVLTIALGLVVLSLYHPILAAFAVLLTIALWFVVIVLGRRGVPLARTESIAKYKLVAWLEELAISHRAVPSGNRLMHSADAHAKGYLSARHAHFVVVFRQRIALWGLQAISMAALLAAGGWLVMEGQLTLGQLVAAELIVSGIGLSLAKLGVYVDTVYELTASAAKLAHLRRGLNTVPTVPDGALLSGSAWTLRVVDATGERLVAPGALLLVDGDEREMAAFVCELLMECPATTRSIAFNDVALCDLRHENARGQICFVDWHHALSGTVFDNAAAAGGPDIDRDRVRKTLARVGFDGDIDQVLDRSGSPLTSQALARIGLARALLSDVALVVVDRTLDVFEPEEAHRLLQLMVGPTRVVLTGRADFAALFDDRMTLSPSSAQPEAA